MKKKRLRQLGRMSNPWLCLSLIGALWMLAFVLTLLSVAEDRRPQRVPPYWAFTVNPESIASLSSKAPDNTPLHVPNSELSFTATQVKDRYSPPDWHPEGHPKMPEVVAHGRKPEFWACGYCHLPNGQGRPENASLAGLPAGYMLRQIADLKSGARKCSEPRHKPVANMAAVATAASSQEISAAVAYFSALPRKPWIRVVETSTVPETHVAGWMLVPSVPAANEPIGQRIIEVGEDAERTELADDASGFIAYVPEGSIAKGKLLATRGGNGRTVPCGKCHGPGFRGSGNVPPIAGRSPSYVVRQLYDIQNGARAGTLSEPMRVPTAKLTLDDMIALAAYVASLRP